MITDLDRFRNNVHKRSPPREAIESKRNDQKVINERYTRHGTRQKDQSNRKNNHDVFTLAEIQTRNQGLNDNYNMYLVNKNRFVEYSNYSTTSKSDIIFSLEKLNFEMKSAFQLENSFTGIAVSPKEPEEYSEFLILI